MCSNRKYSVIKERGGAELKTYYTKCGKTFEKSSTAGTTRFDSVNEKCICAGCEFIENAVTTKKGKEVHITYCQAGSKEPNSKNEYSTNNDNDSSTLSIVSLDMKFLKEVYDFAVSQIGCTASGWPECFHAVDKEDCRKSMPLYFESNKKGKAAKKAIIEKFFPAKTDPEVTCHEHRKGMCASCGHMNDGMCDIHNSVPIHGASEEHGCHYWQIETDKTDTRCESCASFEFTTPSKTWGRCNLGFTKKEIHGNWFTCKQFQKSQQDEAEIIESCINCVHCQPSDKGEGHPLTHMCCNASHRVGYEFDYSSVDNDTASFLQDRANKITEIRFKSVIAIGKELKEAHERLANNKTGTFGAWVESLGMSRRTAENYIQGFDYIAKNFRNIEDAENIQPSLLFAVSKPSAPAELQQAVMEGDITTHKQYKDLEAKLKAEQEAARAASQAIEAAVGRMNEAEKEAQKLEAEKRSIYEAYQKDIKKLNEQLEHAKENSDPEKIQELQKSIETYQRQLDDMSEMLEEKDRQLNEQPIEVKATKVEEVIPEELKQAVVDNVVSNINKFLNISAQEYKIFIDAGKGDPDKYLDIIDDFLFFMQGVRKEIIQKG